jgi:hypothetical protein
MRFTLVLEKEFQFHVFSFSDISTLGALCSEKTLSSIMNGVHNHERNAASSATFRNLALAVITPLILAILGVLFDLYVAAPASSSEETQPLLPSTITLTSSPLAYTPILSSTTVDRKKRSRNPRVLLVDKAISNTLLIQFILSVTSLAFLLGDIYHHHEDTQLQEGDDNGKALTYWKVVLCAVWPITWVMYRFVMPRLTACPTKNV